MQTTQIEVEIPLKAQQNVQKQMMVEDVGPLNIRAESLRKKSFSGTSSGQITKPGLIACVLPCFACCLYNSYTSPRQKSSVLFGFALSTFLLAVFCCVVGGGIYNLPCKTEDSFQGLGFTEYQECTYMRTVSIIYLTLGFVCFVLSTFSGWYFMGSQRKMTGLDKHYPSQIV